jgi:hypothetical protein
LLRFYLFIYLFIYFIFDNTRKKKRKKERKKERKRKKMASDVMWRGMMVSLHLLEAPMPSVIGDAFDPFLPD